MPWVRFDDQFPMVRGMRRLSDATFRVHMSAICWSVRTGTRGRVGPDDLSQITTLRHPRKHVATLVELGFWREVADGWEIRQDDGVHQRWSIERTDYRKKIPAWLRELVFERDGHRCVACGSTEDLSIDHIYPWSRGGPDDEANFQTLCRPCSSSKGARV